MDADATAKMLEKDSETLRALNEEVDLVSAESLEQDKQIAALVELLKENPEEQREQKLTSFYGLSKEVEELANRQRAVANHACPSERMVFIAYGCE